MIPSVRIDADGTVTPAAPLPPSGDCDDCGARVAAVVAEEFLLCAVCAEKEADDG